MMCDVRCALIQVQVCDPKGVLKWLICKIIEFVRFIYIEKKSVQKKSLREVVF